MFSVLNRSAAVKPFGIAARNTRILMAVTISAVMLTPAIGMDVNPHVCKSRNRAVSCNVSVSNYSSGKRKLPILLFDIMDTVVRDPFFHDVPTFFRMPMKELLECQHPRAWIEFEEGAIDEEELARKFFKDRRDFDLEGLKDCMKSGYSYVDGMQELLHALKQNNYEMHAFTNYSVWYEMVEEKLKLSDYLSWTFCSCKMGKRKPDPEFYLEVARLLAVEPSNCIFVDDRLKNVDSATQVGMVGLHFKNADSLRVDLSRLGVDISIHDNNVCDL